MTTNGINDCIDQFYNIYPNVDAYINGRAILSTNIQLIFEQYRDTFVGLVLTRYWAYCAKSNIKYQFGGGVKRAKNGILVKVPKMECSQSWLMAQNGRIQLLGYARNCNKNQNLIHIRGSTLIKHAKNRCKISFCQLLRIFGTTVQNI